jgi:hypothetical protein
MGVDQRTRSGPSLQPNLTFDPARDFSGVPGKLWGSDLGDLSPLLVRVSHAFASM